MRTKWSRQYQDIRASVIDTIRLVSRRADDYLFVGNDDEEDAATKGIEALKLSDPFTKSGVAK